MDTSAFLVTYLMRFPTTGLLARTPACLFGSLIARPTVRPASRTSEFSAKRLETGFEEMRNAADLDETSLPTTKSKYNFWLGAGVSVTAGVPPGTGIVDRLLKSPAVLRKLVCAPTLRRGPFSQRSRPHLSAGSLFPGTYKSASSDQFRGNAEWSLANRGRAPDLRQCCSNNRLS